MLSTAVLRGISGTALAIVLSCLSPGARGADVQALIQDTQRMAREPSRLTLVWWIPTEFWDATLRVSPNVTEETRTRISGTMDDYLVFLVISADVGPLGGITPRDRAAIDANTALLVDGKAIAPVEKRKLSADAQNFVAMMQPALANMLGQIGQGIEVILYPNPAKGARKISASGPGALAYTAFGNRFDWRLPLGSLLPPKFDEKTRQSFPGDYIYNPYTGEKLSETSADPGGVANGSQASPAETKSPTSGAGNGP
jgi:hypothetical protein